MIQNIDKPQIFYENSLQHLQDELKRIDLLIHHQIKLMREGRQNNTPEEYRGLFISEEEVDEFLKGEVNFDKAGTSSSDKHSNVGLINYLQALQTHILQKVTATSEKGVYLPLFRLAHLFHLNPFEIDCLLICLAHELELKYERLYAYLNDDVTKKRPTVDLILKLLCNSLEEKTAARPFFSTHAPLFKYHLLKFVDDPRDAQGCLFSRSLKLDDRIVDFLLGVHGVDARINPFVKVVSPQERLRDVIIPEATKEKINHLFSNLTGDNKNASGLLRLTKSLFYLKGPDRNGQQQAAEAICRDLNLFLLVVDVDMLLGGGIPLELALTLVFREAVLQSSAVYFKGFDRLPEYAEKNETRVVTFSDVIEGFHCLVFLEGERGWEPKVRVSPYSFFTLEFPVPSYPIRKELWESHLSEYPLESGLDIAALANKFQLTRGQMSDAIQTARNLPLMRGNGNAAVTLEDLYEGCRAASNQKLSSLSRKIQPRYGWSDIVLPKDKLTQLKGMCSYVRYRHVVYGDWGFDKKLSLGKGLNGLFFGSSGTGKTMAAEVIAKDLGFDLYKIDLSSVVSKYIGETEKNLSRVFKEAETSNAILFFDEADALFGKRSEVKDAHDRYANIETGYLLQKMEEYEGIVILATNLMKNMDDAFVRRMHFIVEFPFPDEEHRFKIWKTIFPKEAPRDGDIDYEFLSKRFKLAGGNIKNIAVSAAFFAAEDSCKINMKHIIMATKREFQKMGKLCLQSDFGKYYNLIMD